MADQGDDDNHYRMVTALNRTPVGPHGRRGVICGEDLVLIITIIIIITSTIRAGRESQPGGEE